jgi:serine/threonine protein kinase
MPAPAPPPPARPGDPRPTDRGRAETIAMTGPVPPPLRPDPAPAAAPRAPAPGPRAPAPGPSRRSTSSGTSAGMMRTGKRCPTCGERFPIDYRVCPRDVVELEVEAEGDRDPYLGLSLADTYRIVRRIGIGGMGAVYEATHARIPARRFAVKIMHDELARKPELVTRFRREAEVAGLAAHPNSVNVFDVDDTPEGVPFIVAELLTGEDLGQRLDRDARLSLPETVHVVRQLCAALQAAHSVGVVHRDLKPDNVFLVGGPPPTVKLLDFGIARLTDPAAGNRTRTGVVMGTPAYMAPEQARGAHVDHRCDVYAVGAIVYRCLTGKPVFDDDDPAATLTAVLTREPARPRTVAPDLPEAVELVIERAIAREPADRYQSMDELDQALAQLVGDRDPIAAASLPATIASTSLSAAEASLAAKSQVTRARPTLAAMTAVGVLLAVGIIADLLARIIAYRAEDGLPSGTEGALVVVGVLAAIGTPTGLWIRFLRRRVWNNSMRAVALARRVTTTVVAAASTYAGVLVLARLLDLGLSSSPSASAGLLAAMVATDASAIAVLAAIMATRPQRRDRTG